MRIGFDARWLHVQEPIAYNRYLVNLLRSLQRLCPFELYLFTDPHSPVFHRHLAGLDVRVVQVTGHRALIWEQVMIPKALRQFRISLYHAPADQLLPVAKPCPYVITRHGEMRASIHRRIREGRLKGEAENYFRDLNPTHPLLRGIYLRGRATVLRWLSDRRADRIITVSETAKRELIEDRGLPEKKVRVTYLSAEPTFQEPIPQSRVNQVRKRHGLPSRFLLSVGSIARIKNTEGLIRLPAALNQMGNTWPLVICASATHDLQFYSRLASSLNLQEGRDIFYLFNVGSDLPAIYRAATVFVILSWYESFSLPVVEAMAAGTPVIASGEACLPEIVGNGGVIVDPRDTDHVARTAKVILDSPSLLSELKERALERAKFFSWERTASQTMCVYNELLGQHTR